jgi:CRISPR-associated endonuclease Cas1
MAATKTLSQLQRFHNSSMPRHGIVTLFGYGVRVQVNSGHLILQDGIADERRTMRLPRVNHGLKRLVIIGSDGFITFEALRWLTDQDASFVMLERDGYVLATTGPVRPSDAKLRRTQALAHSSGTALRIARELITQKLAGQERVSRDILLDTTTADKIARFRAELPTAESVTTIRLIESQGAAAYWQSWRTLPVNFPRNDLRRIPDHWNSFGARISSLTGSPRLASNPVNAILNYLYALLESEARLAAATLGLDPGMGFMHADTPNRDSLACDLMEPVRPQVDAYVVDWITRQPLKREWFAEQRDGNCRLIGSFAAKLAETIPTWGRAVAPFAEWVARTLWSSVARPKSQIAPPTRLTHRSKREAKGSVPSPSRPALRPEVVCQLCGTSIERGNRYCVLCVPVISKENLATAAQVGRIAAQTPKAQARRSATKRRNDMARTGWLAAAHPAWLNNETYTEKIQPRLTTIPNKDIAEALNVSMPYAADIRAGKRRPHPRHWETLAKLASVLG